MLSRSLRFTLGECVGGRGLILLLVFAERFNFFFFAQHVKWNDIKSSCSKLSLQPGFKRQMQGQCLSKLRGLCSLSSSEL